MPLEVSCGSLKIGTILSSLSLFLDWGSQCEPSASCSFSLPLLWHQELSLLSSKPSKTLLSVALVIVVYHCNRKVMITASHVFLNELSHHCGVAPWSLIIPLILTPGSPSVHRAAVGCRYSVFSHKNDPRMSPHFNLSASLHSKCIFLVDRKQLDLVFLSTLIKWLQAFKVAQ